MVLHQGDFDYEDDPDRFDQLITDTLGPDFPYFASLGNHDVKAARGYQAKLRARLERVEGAECEGDLAILAACSYKGLFFVLSAVGVKGMGSPARHAAFLSQELAASPAPWKICSWHKNQRAMQVGDKEDETGWGVYEACRRQGAIIATAHDHAYARSHLIEKFADTPRVASTGDVIEITKGRTIAFVSGISGQSIRPQKLAGSWWAAIYTATQNADPGALFCTFNPGGRRDRARCYFKTITGKIPDRFELISTLGEGTTPGDPSKSGDRSKLGHRSKLRD